MNYKLLMSKVLFIQINKIIRSTEK